MGVSAFFVHYLTDARTYMPILLWTVLLAFAYHALMTHERRVVIHGLLLAGSVVLLLYSHYFAAMPVLALGVLVPPGLL